MNLIGTNKLSVAKKSYMLYTKDRYTLKFLSWKKVEITTLQFLTSALRLRTSEMMTRIEVEAIPGWRFFDEGQCDKK